MKEHWRDIDGYEGRYQVSDQGEVRSLQYKGKGRIRILKAGKNRGGYLHVTLCVDSKKRSFLVHRLVAAHFIGTIPDAYTVNHKNGNKNDNRLQNLEIVTQGENNLHSITVLGKVTWNKGKQGKGMPRARPVTMLRDGVFVKEFGSIREAASYLEVSDMCIHDCLSGRQHTCRGYTFGFKEN